MEFKILAELAAGNSLNEPLIKRYYIVKAQFDKDKATFSKDELALCQSRITTIEEALKKLTSAEQ